VVLVQFSVENQTGLQFYQIKQVEDEFYQIKQVENQPNSDRFWLMHHVVF
jgi:hypothetical protein